MTPSSPDSPADQRLRLFFALRLPADVRAALAALRAPTGSASADAYKWADPALLHVTLAFLGSQPASMLADFSRVAAEAAAAGRRGRLSLGEVGSFGPVRAPRVLWVGLAGDLASLSDVQGRLGLGLRGVGVRLEDRAFSPHITLARRREDVRFGGPLPWPPTRPPRHLEIPLDEIVLVRSDLSRAGPHYTVLEQFPIGPPAAGDGGSGVSLPAPR